MAVSLVGSPTHKARINFSGSTTASRTPAATGNLLVSIEALYSTTIAEMTLSDNQGAGWANAISADGDADSHVIIRWKIAANTNAHTFTWTETGAGPADIEADIVEITANDSTPLDTIPSNTGTSASMEVTSGTLTRADSIIFMIGSHTGADTTLTEDSADGFTLISENEDNDLGQTYLSQYKIVAATTSQVVNIACGASRAWFACLASFMGPAAGGTVTPPIPHPILQAVARSVL